VLNGIGAVIGNLLGGIFADRIGARTTLIVICVARSRSCRSSRSSRWRPWRWRRHRLLVGLQLRLHGAATGAGRAIRAPAVGIVLSINAAMIYIGITIGSAVGSRISDGTGSKRWASRAGWWRCWRGPSDRLRPTSPSHSAPPA